MFEFPLTLSAVGLALFAAGATWSLTRRAFHEISEPAGKSVHLAALASGLLAAALAGAMLEFGCQQTPDVAPTPLWRDARVVYQSLLIIFLVAATATDLRTFCITDSVTITGMLVGVVGATWAGDLQMAHLWVDWNQEIPQLAGPYRPAWLSTHPHLHGLAWSATGLAVGAGLTWVVRGISRALLGQEALGFGDVMLMGMVGSFLGWQPTVIAFLLAPLCALSVGMAVKLLGNRSYIPYGPYLSLSSLIVMFSWRWIWMLEIGMHEGARPSDRVATFALRRLFGDWLSLVLIAAVAIGGLVLLLGLSRLYRLIPVDRPLRTAVREGNEPADRS